MFTKLYDIQSAKYEYIFLNSYLGFSMEWFTSTRTPEIQFDSQVSVDTYINLFSH